jgi:hypothetical protein
MLLNGAAHIEKTALQFSELRLRCGCQFPWCALGLTLWPSSLFFSSKLSELHVSCVGGTYTQKLALMVSCLAYCSSLKMAVIYPSEASHFLRTTKRYNPEDRIFHYLTFFRFTRICLKNRQHIIQNHSLLCLLPEESVRILQTLSRWRCGSKAKCAHNIAHIMIIFLMACLK